MIRDFIQTAYDVAIRQRLPRKIVVHNGVPVRSGRLLDATDVKPDYEESLLAAMRSRIEHGDDIVVVGGGRGVSTVVARRLAADEGSVTVYEGATSQLELVRETLALNQIDDVTVNHAVVGDPQALWDDEGEADRVKPVELPACDLLVLDCEGSEVGILEAVDLPETVIVETHGVFDAPTDETWELLEGRGMSVVTDRTEIKNEDVHVLTAVRE